MDLIWIVLLILLAIYIPIYIYVRKSEKAHEKGIVPYGPLVMFRTEWGLKMMDRIGKHKKFWNFFGLISVLVSFVLMAVIISIVVIDMALLPAAMTSSGLGIEYALAIPGLNPMLPLVYGIIGLVFAVVIHELAHGFQSRANDLRVDSSGILYGVIPIGAFVEPNEEDIEKASRKTKFHLFAAGITTNFIAAMVLFIVMFASLGGCVTCDYEDNPAVLAVTSDSEAYNINIPTTAIIVEIDGVETNTSDAFFNSINNNCEFREYQLTYVYKDTETTVTMKLGTVASTIIEKSPASQILAKGDQILALSLDGENWTSTDLPQDFTAFMKTTEPGQTLYVKSGDPFSLDEPVIETVTLAKSDSGTGYLGVATTLSGMTFTTPGLMLNVGINPFYGDEDLGDYAMSCLTYISAPFQGYSPVPTDTHWWYECTFMSSDIFWIFIQIIYWMFWLNLVLAVSNALPAIPFDGGYIFSYGVDYTLEKAGMKNEEKRTKITERITSAMSYLMIFAMLLIIVVIIV